MYENLKLPSKPENFIAPTIWELIYPYKTQDYYLKKPHFNLIIQKCEQFNYLPYKLVIDKDKFAGILFIKRGIDEVIIQRLFISKLFRFLKTDIGLLEHVILTLRADPEVRRIKLK